jgi:hypothetical protein
VFKAVVADKEGNSYTKPVKVMHPLNAMMKKVFLKEAKIHMDLRQQAGDPSKLLIADRCILIESDSGESCGVVCTIYSKDTAIYLINC